MAPSKRRGPFESDDDSEDAAGSQSSQSSARKRRRTGRNTSVATGSSNDDEVDVSTPPSDLESEADSENDEDERTATQAELAKRAEGRHQKNEAVASGILERVEMKNFMCHGEYTVYLGPLINFICGQNGSGKSAILTAIILCLGGKASATNRGSALKNFIKEGQDSAKISCFIKNQGDNAYMPDDYGASIEVERNFTRNGTSGFKIKSSSGRIISTKKGDLDDVCDHFVLQMDNPLNILHQDQARQFLTVATPPEKYRFFLKGVLLEQLDADYHLIEEQLDNIFPKIESGRSDLKTYKQTWEVAHARALEVRQHETLRDRIRGIRMMRVWEQVIRQEENLEKYMTTRAELDTKLAATRERANLIRQTYDQSLQCAANAGQVLQDGEAEVQKVRDDKNEEKAEQEKAKAEMHEVQAEHRQLRETVRGAEAAIATKMQEITQEEDRLAEVDGGGAARRRRELSEARDAVKEAADTQKNHSKETDELKKAIDAAADKVTEADTAAKAKRQDVGQQEEQLRNIRNRETPDTVFHRNMPQLLTAIGRETRFRQKPIGPIGKHIKLLKPEWSSLLESFFGNTLNGFVVTCKSDQSIMQSLMKRFNVFVPVNITSPALIDTARTEPDASFSTVLRSMEIDNVLVRKVLVLQHYIENSILIADSEEASRVMFPEHRERPRNVGRCLCFHPQARTKGIMLSHRGGRPAQDPIEQRSGKSRMKTDLEGQVRHQEGIIQHAKEQLLDAQTNFRTCQNSHKQAQQAYQRHKNAARELKIKFEEAEDLVIVLQDAIKEDTSNVGTLEALRTALREAEQSKELNGALFLDADSAKADKKKKLEELTRRLNEFDAKIQGLEETARRLKVEAQKTDKKKQYDLNELNAAEQNVQDGENDLNEVKKKVTDQEAAVESFTAQALSHFARVNVPEGETQNSLTAKGEALKKQLDDAEARLGGSREQIEAKALATLAAYNRAKKDVKDLNELSERLKDTLLQRKDRWELFRKYISTAARSKFTALLSERGFRGKLLLDHKHRRLDLRVEPDITQRSDAGRSAKTLSGGEKSFSQICLLLAIWDAMGSPIRCLDEFDVYMDAVNRTRSVNLLVEAARSSHGKQYVFISPGTASDIKLADDVKAIK